MATVNVTIGMTPEMLDTIDDVADERGWSRAKTVRHYIRKCEESPFEQPSASEQGAEESKGAA
jgi:hypothetical protein